MREFFGAYGKVVDATVMVDRESSRSKGFGFVTFEDASNLDQLVGKIGLTLDDKQVRKDGCLYYFGSGQQIILDRGKSSPASKSTGSNQNCSSCTSKSNPSPHARFGDIRPKNASIQYKLHGR
jgi:hypothetical protein